jgi:hypothetical protein
MVKKTEAGIQPGTSSTPERRVGLPPRWVRPGFFRWTLTGVGLILLAGCAASSHEETPPPRQVEAQQIAPLRTDSAAVQPTPISELVNDTKQFFESKRGKQVLIGAAGLFFLIFALVFIARVVRGNPAARSRAHGRDDDSITASFVELDSPGAELDPSERSHR